MAEWARETPWRQGHLLQDGAVYDLGFSDAKKDSQVVVVIASHDCDLAQHGAIEPNVEVVIGRIIDVIDGNSANAKSTRTLHIRFEGQSVLLAEFLATDRHSIPKSALSNYLPNTDSLLSPENKNTLQTWLASRYRRSAFPDQFEDRLKNTTKLADKISKAIKSHGESISAIFFDVDDGQEFNRVDPDDLYKLGITILHGDLPDYDTAESIANTAKDSIARAFKSKLYSADTDSWKYIQLMYVDVMSEHALSYHQSKNLKQWRLDHISLGADPQQPLLGDE